MTEPLGGPPTSADYAQAAADRANRTILDLERRLDHLEEWREWVEEGFKHMRPNG